MSVPEFVAEDPTRKVRRMDGELPPQPTRRVEGPRPAAPGDRYAPFGRLQGRPAADAGYALALAARFRDRLELSYGENPDDALTAGAMLGIARAAAFGRGPIGADVRVGLELLGYLGGAPADLVQWRRRALHGVRRDRVRQTELVGVDPDVVRVQPGEARALLDQWRSLLPAELPGVAVRPEEETASHRQLVRLVGDGHDPLRVHRFVVELEEHLAAERPRLARVAPAAWSAIERGQRHLMERAVALAEHADAHEDVSGVASELVDLLALQALAEEEAVAGAPA